MQDGVSIYLWRLIENAQTNAIPQGVFVQASHLLASFVEHRGSTACLDLYDEHAVPRLVNMLTQPGTGVARTEAGEAYHNSVAEGQPPPPLTAADVEVQQAVARLLAAAVSAHALCCEQVRACPHVFD